MERVTTKIRKYCGPAHFPEQDHPDGHSDSLDEKVEELDDSQLDLQRTLSLITPVKSKCVREIPNGGLKAWLQVLGSFILFFNSWRVTSFDRRGLCFVLM